MRAVLAQIHYMPDHWAGNAHTHKVREEFSLLFQFKAVSSYRKTCVKWPLQK